MATSAKVRRTYNYSEIEFKRLMTDVRAVLQGMDVLGTNIYIGGYQHAVARGNEEVQCHGTKLETNYEERSGESLRNLSCDFIIYVSLDEAWTCSNI